MFVERKFYVGIRDVDENKNLKNTSLLFYLEEIACIHSDMLGYGINGIEKTKKTWILLNWKVKTFKRPQYGEILKVKTWSRLIDKFYAYRDFDIYNEKNELVCKASSKWVFIDIEKGRVSKIPDDVAQLYETEDIKVFEEEIEKLEEPNDFNTKIDYKISNFMIDVNKHLNNVYYMDIAEEAINGKMINPSKFEIMYKSEIKPNDKIEALTTIVDENIIYVTIKNKEENKTNAIIKLEK